MKKLTVIAIIACAAMFASCKNQPTEEVVAEPVEEEVVVEEAVEAVEEAVEAVEEAVETVAE